MHLHYAHLKKVFQEQCNVHTTAVALNWLPWNLNK